MMKLMVTLWFTTTTLLMALHLRSEESGSEQVLARNEFMVSSDAGFEIYVREVMLETGRNLQRPPVILLHGARVPGVASFDLAVPHGSFAADLTLNGHAVYIMDARGYGRSTRPPQMELPPEANGPLARSDEVVRDIGAVVDAVRQRTGVNRVALLGWATGGHWMGQYASIHSHKVSHLVLYNSLYGGTFEHPMLGRGSANEDPENPGQFDRATQGAYRFSTAESLFPVWDNSIPIDDKTLWRDPIVAEAYATAALASDYTSNLRTPPSFRAPSGAIEDSFYLVTGRQLWDASLIKAPTLVIRSELDFWSRHGDVQKLIEHLVSVPRVEVVTIPQATHFVHLDRPERGRTQFVETVVTFLM
ncbi:MAG: alpha/beta fold hydrolase [Chloroflexi bacterium AL-W]|nr:alpha/beta fold hydrolase [Chloroflexi bacterium AL-N1]NOK70625.1 alpha/beta fold hydrolase [Chloroflexi bacterium AL-N10]NOK77617.1 alpha/beta fold hydrolase [Chloroflexi bacterium AL-N5]NOK84468.1 alpha/beta fold hydrolase [Chloroflexi bacterium AL-W]NOK92357.1 alpha/beta fold hydrolase [Chloroflexi bacterium AL-N15]